MLHVQETHHDSSISVFQRTHRLREMRGVPADSDEVRLAKNHGLPDVYVQPVRLPAVQRSSAHPPTVARDHRPTQASYMRRVSVV